MNSKQKRKELYPLKFIEIYKEYFWGGAGLETLNKNVPGNFAAESWEISCHKNGMSIVEEGPLKGCALQKLVQDYGGKLIGTNTSIFSGEFPLMVKFINAKKNCPF